MTTSRLLIDVVLLALAAANIVFIVRYALYSNWRATYIGRNLMTQKIILTVVTLIFPIYSLFGLHDDVVFEVIQILLFLAILATLIGDVFQLVHAQKVRPRRQHETGPASGPRRK